MPDRENRVPPSDLVRERNSLRSQLGDERDRRHKAERAEKALEADLAQRDERIEALERAIREQLSEAQRERDEAIEAQARVLARETHSDELLGRAEDRIASFRTALHEHVEEMRRRAEENREVADDPLDDDSVRAFARVRSDAYRAAATHAEQQLEQTSEGER